MLQLGLAPLPCRFGSPNQRRKRVAAGHARGDDSKVSKTCDLRDISGDTTMETKKPDPIELICGKEFGRRAKVRVNSLEKMRSQGRGPDFLRIGGAIRYFWPPRQGGQS
jgi:hypothetical protein